MEKGDCDFVLILVFIFNPELISIFLKKSFENVSIAVIRRRKILQLYPAKVRSKTNFLGILSEGFRKFEEPKEKKEF